MSINNKRNLCEINDDNNSFDEANNNNHHHHHQITKRQKNIVINDNQQSTDNRDNEKLTKSINFNDNETLSFRIQPESASEISITPQYPDRNREMAQSGPRVQKPAPQFKGEAVVNGQFKEISLADYKGKYVVLFFYPMDFTFVCPTEIIAFSERADEFRKMNCEVIACSTDSKFTHLAWINTPRKEGGLGEMNIPLLADKNGKISQDYGVYLEDGVPLRGLFIIDGNQILRQITINDLPVGRNVDETIRLVQAFQYTDIHGEVCPANWKPGSDTIKPAPDKSKEYFNKNN